MYIICGSGRSGTSAVARLLHEGGLSVGRDLIEPDASNPEGYFEERAVVAVNEAILNDCGLREWFSTANREEIRDAASCRAEVMRALADEATPAWKDPRFSWTLEAWLPFLTEPPRVIVCLRSPAEVAASVMRYYGMVGGEARRAVEHTWRVQYERLLEIIGEHDLDAMVVEYSALQSDPGAAVTALASFTDARLDASLVRVDLRHHEAPVPEHLRAIYDDVRALGARR